MMPGRGERGGKWNLYETTHVTQEEVLSQIGKFLKITPDKRMKTHQRFNGFEGTYALYFLTEKMDDSIIG